MTTLPLGRPLCNAAHVEIGMPVRVEVEGLPPLAVFQLDDGYYVTDDTCSHGGASLSDGFVEGDEIECPWHSGKFCIKDGKATAFPVIEPIKVYKAAGRRRPGLHSGRPGRHLTAEGSAKRHWQAPRPAAVLQNRERAGPYAAGALNTSSFRRCSPRSRSIPNRPRSPCSLPSRREPSSTWSGLARAARSPGQRRRPPGHRLSRARRGRLEHLSPALDACRRRLRQRRLGLRPESRAARQPAAMAGSTRCRGRGRERPRRPQAESRRLESGRHLCARNRPRRSACRAPGGHPRQPVRRRGRGHSRRLVVSIPQRLAAAAIAPLSAGAPASPAGALDLGLQQGRRHRAVAGAACRRKGLLSENIEVPGVSHLGMGTHRAVLALVTERLAQPQGGWKPRSAGEVARLEVGDRRIERHRRCRRAGGCSAPARLRGRLC